ncbi:MAG TPA: DUF3817 domain-containing protein [Planctomycetota bacterium]
MNPVRFLRRIACVEGVSFLLLLGVAMPLKHLAGKPLAVKVLGWAHGLLFVVFCLALARATRAARWPLGRAALVFLAGLLPFGPFLLDGRLRTFERDVESR